MFKQKDFKSYSYLIYGLGSTGISVLKYLKKKKIKNLYTWDDNFKLRKKFQIKKISKLKFVLNKVDYIVLSPGVSLKKNENKIKLSNFKNKIITDIDLLFLRNEKFKSIVVTGTNGKSTTCKIIHHLLKKNNFNAVLGGNIGTPVLNQKIKKGCFFIIEASSFQLSHSKFIKPNYALLLNITNDHLDWHGSMKNYTDSKFKIFNLQKREDFALMNNNFQNKFKKRKYKSRYINLRKNSYQKLKFKIKNDYLKSESNNENMYFVYTLAKLLNIKKNSFIKALNSFSGLSHRNETFFKKRNIVFINDSKATSFQATKYALSSNKNIYWILGGLPKYNDSIILKNLKKNIKKTYIIGKNTNFFIKQLKNQIKFSVTKTLKKSLAKIFTELKYVKNNKSTVLLSPAAASFDQYKNFEKRGDEFKKLVKMYAKKYI